MTLSFVLLPLRGSKAIVNLKLYVAILKAAIHKIISIYAGKTLFNIDTYRKFR